MEEIKEIKKRPPGVQVADIDAILVQDVWFVLHGKDHVISPLTVDQFFLLTARLQEVHALTDSGQPITKDMLVEKYYNLMNTCCDTITKEDIEMMTQQQTAALFEVVVNTISGKIFTDAEKKSLQRIRKQNELAQTSL